MAKYFSIGKKVLPDIYYDVYKLVINNMSGDDISNEQTETFFKRSETDILSDVIELCEFSNGRVSRETIHEAYEELKFKHEHFFKELDREIVTRDVFKYGERIAIPSVHSLTYFDSTGVEYKINY